jgi:hypothetical protein
VESIVPHQGGVLLTARGTDGGITRMPGDHVIAATGYRPDLCRLPFLESQLRETISQLAHTPNLSDHFETSVPGLHVVGPLAANTFGPLMRFMVGAEYSSPRLAAHLVRTAAKVRAA